MFIYKLILGHLFVTLQLKVLNASNYPWLEQISRQETLSSGCDNLKLKSKNFNHQQFDHILVDHKHKFLYCYVPKVACTNWKRVLMVLTGRSNATDLVKIPASVAHSDNSSIRLSDLDENTAVNCLKNYTTFLMVRHPFERLLSAYRNKFEDNSPSAKYFQARYGKRIIKHYRKNPKYDDIKTGVNVSFREFVQYLIVEGLNETIANEHWKQIYQLCHPCHLNYTFIGRYEKFEEDSQVLLKMIGAPFVVFPHTRGGNTANKLRHYYQQLSLSEIEKLYRLYEFDFKLFDYTLEYILGFDIG